MNSTLRKVYLLDWCKSSCSFCAVEICCLILEYILKCGCVIILMHISCFMIFAKDLLLAVYFVFILGYENDFRQKANKSNFFATLFF